ncbi:MAG: type III polyketide synthase, partial [Planctomyces sp.]
MIAPAAAILGMGLATPTYSARQPQTTALALAATLEDPSQAALVAGLYSRAGVDRRGSVLLRSETGDGHGPDQSVFPSSTGEHWPTTADRMRVFDQHATGLALEAARRALADAGVLPGQITDLLTVSCTGL